MYSALICTPVSEFCSSVLTRPWGWPQYAILVFLSRSSTRRRNVHQEARWERLHENPLVSTDLVQKTSQDLMPSTIPRVPWPLSSQVWTQTTTAAAGSSAVIQGPLQEVQGHQGLPVRGVYWYLRHLEAVPLQVPTDAQEDDLEARC